MPKPSPGSPVRRRSKRSRRLAAFRASSARRNASASEAGGGVALRLGRLLGLLGSYRRRHLGGSRLALDQELGALAQAPHVARLGEVEEGEHGQADEGGQARERA